MSIARRIPLPSLTWVRWIIVPAVAFIALCQDRGYQTDFWLHLARGRQIVATGHVVTADQFTYTVGGDTIRDGNWLAQVIFHDLFEWGGLSLVQVANAGVIGLMLLLVVRMCQRESGSLRAAMIAGAFTFLGLWQILLIRPQTFSLLLFVLLYGELLNHRSSQPSRIDRHCFSVPLLIVPPILMALWCNLHGGFAIGLVLIGAFALARALETILTSRNCISANASSDPSPLYSGERARVRGRAPNTSTRPRFTRASFNPYARSLFLSTAATLLNPYGWRIYLAVGAITSRASARGIEEWLPANPHWWIGQVFIISILALLALYWSARRRPSLLELSLILCFLPLACRSMRMIAWWLLAMAPIFATLFKASFIRAREDHADRPSWIAAGLTLILAIGAFLSLPWLESWNPLMGRFRSAHRVEDDLAAIVPQIPAKDRIFSRLEWGGYLDCKLGPTHRVFMDGWIEMYSDPLWADYQHLSAGAAGWQNLLRKWQIHCLILDSSYHGPLLSDVRRSGLWSLRASSGSAQVWVRRPAEEPLAKVTGP